MTAGLEMRGTRDKLTKNYEAPVEDNAINDHT